MPQVPYTPYSTAEPTSGGERLSVSTPPAAFGANIGAALGQLGSTTEQVGGELFSRAMALQDLRNETDAREAQTAYAEKASQLHAEYGALEGKAAADGLKDYIKKQDDARQEFRGSLKTAFAQRYYDRDTLPFMQRNIFSAAGHAADQNKSYVVGTAQAQKDTAAESFVDPKDDAEFAHKLEINKSADETIALALGKGPEQITDMNLKTTSKLWRNRIEQLSLQDPQAALTMLDGAAQSKAITQDDYKPAAIAARAQNRAVGSANLINSIYSSDKTATQMEEEVKASSPNLAHGDPMFEKDALTALHHKIGDDRYFKKQDDDAATQKIYGALGEGVADIREMRLKPGMANLIDNQLNDKQRAELPSLISRFNDRRDKKGEDDTFTGLMVMSSQDREGFLDKDFTKYNLSDGQIRQLYAKRDQVLAKPTDDPAYNGALSIMRKDFATQLKNLNVYYQPVKGADDTEYRKFTGALQIGIDAWRQDNGKPPSPQDIREHIAPEVLRTHVGPGMLGLSFGWFGRDLPRYDQDASAAKNWWEANPKYADEIKNRTGGEASDDEIMRAFIRNQFIELYKGSSSGGPVVPQSK